MQVPSTARVNGYTDAVTVAETQSSLDTFSSQGDKEKLDVDAESDEDGPADIRLFIV